MQPVDVNLPHHIEMMFIFSSRSGHITALPSFLFANFRSGRGMSLQYSCTPSLKDYCSSTLITTSSLWVTLINTSLHKSSKNSCQYMASLTTSPFRLTTLALRLVLLSVIYQKVLSPVTLFRLNGGPQHKTSCCAERCLHEAPHLGVGESQLGGPPGESSSRALITNNVNSRVA